MGSTECRRRRHTYFVILLEAFCFRFGIYHGLLLTQAAGDPTGDFEMKKLISTEMCRRSSRIEAEAVWPNQLVAVGLVAAHGVASSACRRRFSSTSTCHFSLALVARWR